MDSSGSTSREPLRKPAPVEAETPSSPSSSASSSKRNRPRPLLTKSFTSGTAVTSSTASLIHVGASTSTAADGASVLLMPSSTSSSSSSSRSFTPLSQHTQPTVAETGDQIFGNIDVVAPPQDESIISPPVGQSHQALDLLYKVNHQAVERAAVSTSAPGSLRSRFSQRSVRRTNTTESGDRALTSDTFEPPPPPPSSATPLSESKSGNQLATVQGNDDGDDADSSSYPDRKYYILSSAGKPIYVSHSRHSTPQQDEEEDESSTTQVGVMQALISIFVDEDSDKLRFLRRGKLLIVFLLRAPLYLVCVSEWGEEPSTLRQHLEYLHLQVISLVSASQLSRLFGRMPNFDLRRLIEGTEGIFDHFVTQLNANHADAHAVTDWAVCHQWWLQALQPIRITIPNLRDLLTAALQPPSASPSMLATSQAGPQRPKDLLYILLIANGRIVTLLRPKKHSVHPTDLLLLINTVSGSKSIQRSGGQEDAEIWLPFSLPKFAPHGFVHAYVKFFDPLRWTVSKPSVPRGATDLAVIVVTADKDSFPVVSNWIGSLVPPSSPSAATKLTTFQTHVLALYMHLSDPLHNEDGSTSSGRPTSAYTCAEIGLAGLRHFVYRSNASIQLTSPALPEPYCTSAHDRKRLFTLYSLLHHNIHHPEPPTTHPASPASPPIPPLSTTTSQTAVRMPDKRLKMQLLKTPHEQVLGWITVPFELYLCVHPNLSKLAIVGIANTLTKWIKQNEKHLFLVNAGTF